MSVAVAPRHGSLIGGGPCNSSGSLPMLDAMRRASSLLSSLAISGPRDFVYGAMILLLAAGLVVALTFLQGAFSV